MSDNITSKEYSIVSMESFEIYSQNHNRDTKKYILGLDKHNYYMMNIIDYLVGNTDRHWGNWGVLINNRNNKPVCIHRLMDFNQAFRAYDSLDGANCQTTFREHITQKEAAIQAVSRIGLNQIQEVKRELFHAFPQYYDMFVERLELLKSISSQERIRKSSK